MRVAGMIITSDYGSFPKIHENSLLSTSKMIMAEEFVSCTSFAWLEIEEADNVFVVNQLPTIPTQAHLVAMKSLYVSNSYGFMGMIADDLI